MINNNFNIQNVQLSQSGNVLLDRLEREQRTDTDFVNLLQQAVADITAEEGTENGAIATGLAAPTGQSQLKRAAIEMESWFINQMFQAMRRTVPEGEGMFEMSNAERIWRDMLDEQTAQNLAEGGGLGLATTLYQQLQRVNVG